MTIPAEPHAESCSRSPPPEVVLSLAEQVEKGRKADGRGSGAGGEGGGRKWELGWWQGETPINSEGSVLFSWCMGDLTQTSAKQTLLEGEYERNASCH